MINGYTLADAGPVPEFRPLRGRWHEDSVKAQRAFGPFMCGRVQERELGVVGPDVLEEVGLRGDVVVLQMVGTPPNQIQVPSVW